MSKKSKPSKQKKHVTANSSPVDKTFDLIGHLIFQGDYQQAVAHCERLLNYLPQQAQQRAEVLSQLGIAHAMLQNFRQSYEVLTEAIVLAPKNADLWYNRSTASRFALRLGQAVRDIEQAVKLNTRSELREKYNQELQLCRKLAQTSIEMRGPDFTLEQLIEQETLFQQGLQFMEAGKPEEAGQAFEASIAMSDCLPQPWGNLGICLLMQERYDEAEAALKRALVLDPQYTLAKDNLAALPEIRRTGPPRIVFNEPFQHTKLKQSIQFVKEE
jgi:tetratricopeptide (TPR) repeat protein